MESSAPIATFLRTETTKPVSLDAVELERLLNIASLQKHMEDLRSVVQKKLQHNRKSAREAASKVILPQFTEGDFVLVAREDFFAGEKLAVRWRGPRRVAKALNDYFFQVEDLRNGQLEDVHGTRKKFYREYSLNTTAIMHHVLASETGITVALLMRVEDTADGINDLVRWKGLTDSEDSLEPLERVFEDVHEMVKRPLSHKNTLPELAEKLFA